jgi:hypothetical protein
MLARSAFRPRRQNSHRADATKRAPGYLQWLRGRPCRLADRGGCAGKVRACHVDYAGDKGMATKVSDRHAIPMCDEHHRCQHTWGWQTFEANFKINALADAAAYWTAWPGRFAWEIRYGA